MTRLREEECGVVGVEGGRGNGGIEGGGSDMQVNIMACILNFNNVYFE